MRRVVLALILALFIVGCSNNNITGSTVIDVEEALADSCSDSDGGIAADVQGTIIGAVNGEEFEDDDRCIAGFLVEYYCEDNKPANQNIRCTDKCSLGACV